MAHQISVVAWDDFDNVHFMVNTGNLSYLYDLEDLQKMMEISDKNPGVWQLSLICDLSQWAKKRIGCPLTWRPTQGAPIRGFDALLQGSPIAELEGVALKLSKMQRIDMDGPAFRTMWFAHMRERAGDGPGGAVGGRLASVKPTEPT